MLLLAFSTYVPPGATQAAFACDILSCAVRPVADLRWPCAAGHCADSFRELRLLVSEELLNVAHLKAEGAEAGGHRGRKVVKHSIGALSLE